MRGSAQRLGQKRPELPSAHLPRSHCELAVAPGSVGAAVDLHVVGRVEEGSVNLRTFANHALQEVDVAAVAASEPMFSKYPDVTDLGPRLDGDSRDDFVVGIVGGLQYDIDLSRRKAGQREIEVDIDRADLVQLKLEDLEVPAGIERDLVVGQPQRLLLGIAEPFEGNRRHLDKTELLGCSQTAMPGDQRVRLINEHWVRKPELADGLDQLFDLALGMGPRIARIGLEHSGGPINYSQAMRGGVRPRSLVVHAKRNIMATRAAENSPQWPAA